MADVKFQPKGYHSITPYLCVKGAGDLLAFLKQAFNASEIERHDRPDGTIMHAEVRIGDSTVMVSDACEQMGPMPAGLYLYVEDVDAVYRKALQAGATSVMEPAAMFWGDRMASVSDPSGNQWSIATHVEDVPPEQIEQRAREFAAQTSGPS